MNIGILNTGNVGSRLARAWASADHQLVLAKDGEARKTEPLLAELGGRAKLGIIKEAAEFSDVALFSVYWPRSGRPQGTSNGPCRRSSRSAASSTAFRASLEISDGLDRQAGLGCSVCQQQVQPARPSVQP